MLIDLRFVRDCAANAALFLNARGGGNWVKGDWETPRAGARFRLVKYATFGDPPAAWFTQIHPADPALSPVVRWNTRAIHWAGALAGRPFPKPVYAPVSDPAPVAHWLSWVLRDGGTPHVFTFPGSAVRLCRTARQDNIDIAGAHFTLSGEPITEARSETIRGAGCDPAPRYGSMECGAIGYGCERREHADEVHLLTGMHALIQAGADGEVIGLPPTALLITALHPHSPFLMINTSMGDQAQLTQRDCGCPLEQLGWRTHLHSVRSFEKLTGGGVTFLGTDVIRILEEALPSCFGGKPTDYQLAEAENRDGEPQLVLRVHPSVGEVNEPLLAEAFLAELSSDSNTNAAMAQRWRDSNTLRIARRPPAISRAGKILHLHTGATREE
ncbi:MAG: hypothetical protein GY953_00035 [bacterium]|nr:hypothetical protein [bacterium]